MFNEDSITSVVSTSSRMFHDFWHVIELTNRFDGPLPMLREIGKSAGQHDGPVVFGLAQGNPRRSEMSKI